MIFAWLRRRRRRKILAAPFPRAWTSVLDRLPFYAALQDDEKKALRSIAAILVAEKYWTGCGGLQMTEAIKVAIAAQASLPLLRLPHDYYEGVDEILVYPREFFDPRDREDMHGITHAGEALAGQAHLRGPIVLAWNEAEGGMARGRDGRNVVLHEFAHRLDMADGWADGVPLVPDVEGWAALMERERRLLARERGRSVLDPYGKDDPAEFFAVAVEAFFEKGGDLSRARPELYAALRDFFRQDPASRGT